MPKDIDRPIVERMVQSGVQLVEVLPAEEYTEDHLPGAVGIPLKRIEVDAPSMLDRNRPVVVYCWDAA